MKITIIADASYCHRTKAAGYGYWIASGRGKRPGGGPMRRKVDGSCAAEMMAVVNALHAAIQVKLVQEGDFVLLQTDCQNAIDIFEGRVKPGTLDQTEAKGLLWLYRREHGISLAFRHVKGHSRKQEARYITNNLCDQRAKEGMRFARQWIERNLM